MAVVSILVNPDDHGSVVFDYRNKSQHLAIGVDLE
jgi:hypothetical protein